MSEYRPKDKTVVQYHIEKEVRDFSRFIDNLRTFALIKGWPRDDIEDIIEKLRGLMEQRDKDE